MAGTAADAGGTGSRRHAVGHREHLQAAPERSQDPGLDLANTPYMIMSGHNGMDMNGADASAAAGFNTTKPNWHYTGPALPQAEAQRAPGRRQERTQRHPHGRERLRAQPDRQPGRSGAEQYVQATSAAVSRYATPAAAMAAGYDARLADRLSRRRTT